MATTTALKSNIRALDQALNKQEDDPRNYHDDILKTYHDATESIPNHNNISSYLLRAKVRQFRKDLRTKDNPQFLSKLPTEIMDGYNEAFKHGDWCLFDDKNNKIVDSSIENVKDVVGVYRDELQTSLDNKLNKTYSRSLGD